MHPVVGQLVFASDGRVLGPLLQIEVSHTAVLTGIVVRRDDDLGQEARFPAAWIARIHEERIELTVTSADITPLPMDLTRPIEPASRRRHPESGRSDQ